MFHNIPQPILERMQALTRGGLLAADNATNHRETLQPIIDRAHEDPRVAALVVPIDNGVLLCRKL